MAEGYDGTIEKQEKNEKVGYDSERIKQTVGSGAIWSMPETIISLDPHMKRLSCSMGCYGD